MKRLAVFLIIFSLSLGLAASVYDLTDGQLLGSGLSGIATSGEYASMFANPASLTASTEGFYLQGYYGDYAQSGLPLVYLPNSGLVASFCGTNLAFSADFRNNLSDRVAGTDGDTYKAINTTRLQLDLAYTFHWFSIGASVRATTYMGRSPVSLGNGQRLFDYMVESLFKRYDQNSGASEFSAGLGILLDYDWLKVALVSSKFASVTTDGAMAFSLNELYKSLGVGCTFSTPVFNKEGELNLMRLLVSGELVDMGDSEKSKANVGLLLRFQFLPDYQMELRTGYTEPKGGNAFSNHFTEASQTFGLGLTLGPVRLDGGITLPIAWYYGDRSHPIPFTVTATYVT